MKSVLFIFVPSRVVKRTFWSLLLVLFVSCVGVPQSDATAINWTHEWVYHGTNVWDLDENGRPTPVDVSNNIQTSGRLEWYAADRFEIKNFQFTLIDAVGDVYPWSVSNLAATAGPEVLNSGGLFWDTHLGDCSSCVSFGSAVPYHVVSTAGLKVINIDFGYPDALLQPQFCRFCGADIFGVFIPIAAVPEPSSVLLLAVGLIGLAWWRRKQHAH